MKIAIDISPLIYETGVSTYTRNLVESLLKIDKNNDYILFGGSLRRFKELKNLAGSIGDTVHGNNIKIKMFPIPPTLADRVWNRLHILPIEKLLGNIDVFHSSDWTQPPSNAFKVTTIHDLIPVKYPKLSHPKVVSAHQTRLKWVKSEVDRVIVPSQVILEDSVAFGIERSKLRVIPEAPDPIYKKVKKIEIERLRKKYRIIGGYLLAVGVNPRKNTDRIIEAYGKIQGETKLKLVVVGHKYIDSTPKRGVVFLGHVPSEDLPGIYSGASVLIYPSLYEGFGLPILEAFACGIPVVTSNVGSMAEVAGKTAVLVDPYSVNSISEGIMDALKNKEELVNLGIKRAKNFSWVKTARETLKVYHESIENSS